MSCRVDRGFLAWRLRGWAAAAGELGPRTPPEMCHQVDGRMPRDLPEEFRG